MENQVKVRRKEAVKSNYGKSVLFVSIVVIGLLGVVSSIAAASYFGLFDKSNEINEENGGRVIRVAGKGKLQDAINKAESGDIIELEAGTIYSAISLPNKPIKDFITIRTSAYKQLPENVRVNASQAKLMAKIVAIGQGKPALTTENAAHHFRFIGIEFTPNEADYVYNLVYLAAETNKVADIPHDLEFDRCYFHPNSKGKTRRGIGLNSGNTTIKNSHLEGFAFPQEETQAIGGWTGTRNIKILNNYLEGGAENVMFGGSDPASADLVPMDIEVRGNYFYKPDAWKGVNTVKCLFELKNAKRVQVIGNYFENNLEDAAFRITIRNQDGKAPFSTIEDVVIQDNVINGAAAGINILGKDDTFPSQTMKRLKIVNNLFLNIGNGKFEGQGGGYFIQICDGEDILIANNTSFNQGNAVTFHDALPKNTTFRDNIMSHGSYGIHGLENFKTMAPKFFKNNVIVNNKGLGDSDLSKPSDNFLVQSLNDVGFVGIAQNNFRLSASSKFKGIGCNLDTVAKETVKK
jgi:type II secretory pathway pseudopilin PulG